MRLCLRVFILLLTSCTFGFSQKTLGLSGNWQLTAKSDYFGGTNFTATLAITQNGSKISGTITYQGNPCVGSPTADFVGRVDPILSIDVTGRIYSINFSGTGQITAGTYTSKYTTPGINWAACNPLDPGDAGTWTATESPLTAPKGPPPLTIDANGVVSGASCKAGVASNSWITIFWVKPRPEN
jgi:hypothetical protein